ncbi:MAG: aminotransferase class V-fold PLP-dependent enzyme, partial [Gammaproteobacteria bacterium]|nr:aminotransferase class V-fold PLP-dependent enzyme [Gammaproteobacteria bacterium]
RLRQLLKGLINAPSVDDISLMKSTSEALSVVAYGIDWNAGENIVIFAQEFPSNRIVWQSLKSLGVETRLVDLEASEDPEMALFAACDSNTRLISTSSVQYARGQRIDLTRIGEYCKAQDILFCIDAIQSLGALPFDVQQYQADFVMADGHKWMLGPEGLALLYTKAEAR